MDKLINEVLAGSRSAELRQYVENLLLEICRVDTSPFADVSLMRKAEAEVFNSLERELSRLPYAGARMERRLINPEIAKHPGYSQLYFTKTPERPEGLSPEETYAGRSNLLYFVPGENGVEANGVALNAHIDVVKPFVPPYLKDGIVFGRGACDDKGAVVCMLTALKLLAEVLHKNDKQLRRNVLAMLVIEEETGGNGSLSLAIDRELKKLYDSILVLECCSNNIHPANRGAVWYRADLECPGANLLEMAAFVYERLELEGRAIKAESRHQLFPQRPVQTCHGMLGEYGEHPSRICGEVAFELHFAGEIDARAQALVEDGIESALADYLALYGDKSKVIDPSSGKAKVTKHYELRIEGHKMVCLVHGSTGHMGSIMENDGAITKMATMLRRIFRMKEQLAKTKAGAPEMRLHGEEPGLSLKLEGGQGFVPTHHIDEIMHRMRKAAIEGAANYLHLAGLKQKADDCVTMSYDKLHNAAFDGDPDSPQMRNAIAAGKAAGIWRDGQAVAGWTVSCDSRLFAFEYPEMPVLTSGAGLLQHAHADNEQVEVDELLKSIAFIALYLLKEAGVCSKTDKP
ncbi:MAG: M20/M25/M40 family metallo-hydrolase [Oligosphaeraceae bacterium]|nr:M20/M25/M40 family metallo-hydrolase [Oligosphaeraceae bacterium]